MKKVIAIVVLLCLGGLVCAGPIEDAVGAKLMELHLFIAMMIGETTEVIYGFAAEEISVFEVLAYFEEVIEYVSVIYSDLAEFTQNIKNQGVR